MTWRCKEPWQQQPWYWPNSHTIFHHQHSKVEVDPSKNNLKYSHKYSSFVQWSCSPSAVTSPHRWPVMQPRLPWDFIYMQFVCIDSVSGYISQVIVVARLSLSGLLIAAALSKNLLISFPKTTLPVVVNIGIDQDVFLTGLVGGGAHQGIRALSQYKDHFSRYGNFHYKDKTVVRPSYLYNGNSYTSKMASL